ncbi:MAG: hypothetical protein HY644_10285 [Acidobacteria bacterium]|nr:hypothetical protein [Acidobacteriota bacterium]
MQRSLVIALTFCGFVFTASLVLGQPQEEYAALLKVLKEPSIEARIQVGEEFLQKYPKSTYVPNVRQRLVYDYHEKNNAARVIEHGEQASSIKDAAMSTFLASAYAEKKNDAKSLEAAQTALQLLSSGGKPEGLSEKQWAAQKNSLTAVNQYLIGTAYSHQGQRRTGDERNALLAKGRQALMAAVKLNPKYDFAYYQLGLTLADMGEGPDACAALAKAVVLGGSVKTYAQLDLERIYIHYNKSKLGLDKLLAKAKAELK